MYPPHVRRTAVSLLDSGFSYSAVSRCMGIHRSTLREWRQRRELIDKYVGADLCVRCEPCPRPPEPQAAYSYLLGLYLGDGYISPVGDRRKRIWRLRIACAFAWPGLTEECLSAIRAIRSRHTVGTVPRTGYTEVYADWKHWPCLFPQHGPGRKNTRRIELASWQEVLVEHHTECFVRGLIHSDGSRVLNRVRRRVAGTERQYEYPRYFFTNTSQDILGLMGEALDRLGIEWRMANARNLSVAKHAAVARLDEFIGPKY